MVAAVVLLLFLFVLQAVLSLRGKFATFDEAFYLSAGHSYLATGDTRMVNRFHPPLAQVLVALPLVGLDLKPPERDPAWWLPKSDLSSRTFALNFLYRNRTPWQTILSRGRLMMVGFGALVGLLVFLWALELWGVRAGLLALALYAFSPNLLAHARLATTDFAVAGLSFAACYSLWRLYRQPRALRLMLAGLLLGLALLSKLSALILCPVVLLLSILYVLAPRKRTTPVDWRGETDDTPALNRGGRGAVATVAVLVIAALACAVIWLGYAGSTASGSREEFIREVCSIVLRPTVPQTPMTVVKGLLGRAGPTLAALIPWPKQYWELLAWLVAKSDTGHRAFLAGRLSQSGWWYYFPVVLAIKTPLPTLILAALALAVGWSQRSLFDRLFLLIPPTVFLLASMSSHINIGYRHILPALPFVLVFASQVGAWPAPTRARRWGKRALVGALVTWCVAGTVRVAPHYLAYFNELVGGPRRGYHYLVDSNLDWGQDLLGLRDYMRQHNIDRVKLAYFGLATPDIIRSVGVAHEPVTRREESQPTPGTYAISATRLQGAYGVGVLGGGTNAPFAWLKRLEPEAVIGYSIFVYRVTEADAARLKEQGL